MALIEQDIAKTLSDNLRHENKLRIQDEAQSTVFHQRKKNANSNFVENSFSKSATLSFFIDQKKRKLLEHTQAFEKVIEASGPTYSPVLSQCKKRYDSYISHLEKLQVKRVSRELVAEQAHTQSASEIYHQRHEELRRKISLLQKKKELKQEELSTWEKKEYKLKLKPDVIEIDPQKDERLRRDLIHSQPPAVQQIPDIEINKLSYQYSVDLKNLWNDRFNRLLNITATNFVSIEDFNELKQDIRELKSKYNQTVLSTASQKELNLKLKQLLNKLKASHHCENGLRAVNSDTVLCSLPEVYQEDTLLLEFWRLLEEEQPMKAVSLAVANSRFHVSGTMAIFIDYDRVKQGIQPFVLANNREFDARSSALQFAQALNQISYVNSHPVSTDLSDLIIELLREKASLYHTNKASSTLALRLSLISDSALDKKLATKIFLKWKMYDEYFKNDGTEYKHFKTATLQTETWKYVINKHSKTATTADLQLLQKLYKFWYERKSETQKTEGSTSDLLVGFISSCEFFQSVVNLRLRKALVKSLGGWGSVIEDDRRGWCSCQRLQEEDPELMVMLLVKSMIDSALVRINEIEKSEYDFYF